MKQVTAEDAEGRRGCWLLRGRVASRGVPPEHVEQAARGHTAWKGERREYAAFEATDGYRVVFGLSELADEISGRRMLLADEMDGKPLSPSDGPWRLIVPGDLHATRWIRQAITVTVRRAP